MGLPLVVLMVRLQIAGSEDYTGDREYTINAAFENYICHRTEWLEAEQHRRALTLHATWSKSW